MTHHLIHRNNEIPSYKFFSLDEKNGALAIFENDDPLLRDNCYEK